jgi:hypothetical protein
LTGRVLEPILLTGKDLSTQDPVIFTQFLDSFTAISSRFSDFQLLRKGKLMSTIKQACKTVGFEYFFGPITGVRNKKRTLQNAQWETLPMNIWFNGYEYAVGSEYKRFESENFGYVVFSPDAKTPDGSIPGKRIHRF